LTPPPSKPQRGVRATFASLLDGFIAWLVDTFYNELLALVSSLNSLAAGGAYAIPFLFDTGTTAADPTSGKLRVNNAALGSATAIYASWNSSAGKLVNAYLNSFNDSTSVVKGHIRLVSFSDPTRYIIFAVNGLVDNGAYKTISVTFVSATVSGTFGAGEALNLHFQRTGDKGDTGLTVFHAREEQASGTNGAAGALVATDVYRRALNTVKTNQISGVALSGNQITGLPAGSYKIRARAPMVFGGITPTKHRVGVYDATNGAYLLVGSAVPCFENTSGGSDYVEGWAEVTLCVTLASTRTIELRSLTAGSGTLMGYGRAASISGQAEAYSEIFIEKVG
jgi:hypothetical protein